MLRLLKIRTWEQRPCLNWRPILNQRWYIIAPTFLRYVLASLCATNWLGVVSPRLCWHYSAPKHVWQTFIARRIYMLNWNSGYLFSTVNRDSVPLFLLYLWFCLSPQIWSSLCSAVSDIRPTFLSAFFRRLVSGRWKTIIIVFYGTFAVVCSCCWCLDGQRKTGFQFSLPWITWVNKYYSHLWHRVMSHKVISK